MDLEESGGPTHREEPAERSRSASTRATLPIRVSRNHSRLTRVCQVTLLVATVHCASPAPAPSGVGGAAYDTATSDALAPGIRHRRLVALSGPFTINVVEVDLRRRDLVVRAARAFDSLRGRERTSSIAARAAAHGAVLAAVNADFFSLRTGENENNQIIDGEVVKGLAITDSPFDSLHTVHSQFGMTCAGKPVIDRFSLDAAVITPPPASVMLPLDAINFRGRGDAAVLYTARYGQTPAADSVARDIAELPLQESARAGDTMMYRVDGAPRSGGGLTLERGAAALSGSGLAAELIRRFGASSPPGTTLRVVERWKPNRGALCTLVGGWPRVVRDGRDLADSADRLEGTFPRFSVTRHPRTAVGFSRDSTTLYLVTVDGRSESSSGMSLAELSALLRSLGVQQALNLDGGGSTTLVLHGRVVNQPSDSAGERTVGNALLVQRR